MPISSNNIQPFEKLSQSSYQEFSDSSFSTKTNILIQFHPKTFLIRTVLSVIMKVGVAARAQNRAGWEVQDRYHLPVTFEPKN